MVPGFVSKSAWLYRQFTQQANLQNYHAWGRGKVEDKTNHKSTLIGLAVPILIIPNLSLFFFLVCMLSCWTAREEGTCFCPPYPWKPSINLELAVHSKIYIGFWSLNQEIKKSKSKPEASFLWLSRAGSFPLLYLVPCHNFFWLHVSLVTICKS